MRNTNLIERMDYQPKRHWMAAIPALISLAGAIGSKFIPQKTEGGGTSTSSAAAAPAAAKSTVNAASVAPGTNPDQFRNQESAYWNQLLAGTGNTQPGGGLPQNVQENIDRQASLIGPGQ